MKTKRPLAEMEREATLLAGLLRPACERIEIAGSIRRKCKEIGDIELVAIPKPVLNLLGEPVEDETQVDWWLAEHNGIALLKNGPRYKQFYAHQGEEEPGLQVDLFLATPDNWGYILMLRTGPAEFSKRMVTPKAYGGLLPRNLKPRDGQLWFHGKAMPAPTERELFRLWGMEYIEPEARQ